MENNFVHKSNDIRRKAGDQNFYKIVPFGSGLSYSNPKNLQL